MQGPWGEMEEDSVVRGRTRLLGGALEAQSRGNSGWVMERGPCRISSLMTWLRDTDKVQDSWPGGL